MRRIERKGCENLGEKISFHTDASKAKPATEKPEKKMRIISNQKAESVKRECGNAQPGRKGKLGGNVRIQGREAVLVEKKANGPQKNTSEG